MKLLLLTDPYEPGRDEDPAADEPRSRHAVHRAES
jgi:hypothetical protein